MNKVFIGIDPGASGGIGYIYNPTGSIEFKSMPDTEGDVWVSVNEWVTMHRDRPDEHACTLFAVIEKVGGFVAGNPAPGSAMFKFGRNVGVLVGCLIAAGIPFEEVTPQKWMKEFGIQRRPNETKTAFKNRLKAVAQGLFPGEKVTLATADALLIAEYARRKHS